jgi:YggT family protein
MLGLLALIFQIFYVILFARIILSWVIQATRNPVIISIYQITHQLTEPLLAPIRNILPPMGGFDFSPLVLLFILSALQRAII